MVTYRLATEGQLYLASLALASIAVCCAGLVAVRLLRRRSTALRHGLLLCALCLCAVSPLAIGVALIFQWGWVLDVNVRVGQPESIATRAPRTPRVAAEVAETFAAPAPAPPSGAASDPPATIPKALPGKPAQPRLQRDFQAVNEVKMPVWPLVWAACASLWFLGAVFCLVRLLRGHRVVRKLRRSLTAPADERLTRLLQDSVAQVNTRRRVRLWESRLAPAPLSFGVLRPVIVLPTALAPELDDEQLRLVLKHEVAHVARRDHAWALVERLALEFFWWNLALRRVNRRLAEFREQICDDYAAGGAGERRQLAEVLVKIAGWNPPASLHVRAATALVDDARDDLAGRVTRLVENRPRSMHLTPRAAIAVAVFACLLSAMVLLATLRAAPIERLERTPEQKILIAELQQHGISVMDDSTAFHVDVDDRRATDADVARLVELKPIGDLRLSGEKLTDVALESVGRMSDLTKLSLGFGSDFPFSEKGLAHLKSLENLGELTISSTYLNDAGLASLRSIPHLFKLTLTSSSVSDAGLAQLPDFPELEELSVSNSRRRISDDGIKSLARIPRLAGLSIVSNDITDAGLQALSQCATLTTLSLQGNAFTDEGLRAIATSPHLTSLALQGQGFTADGIRALKAAPNLDTFRLANCPQLNDDSLAAVGELVQLRRLTLNSNEMTDAGLAHLNTLVNLQSFDLHGKKFTGEGMSYLSPCQEVNKGTAQGERIGDEIFAPLNQFPKLRVLTVGAGQPRGRSRITDAGLSRLTSTSLEFATFNSTGLTEASFETLEKLPNLRSAHFPWTPGVNPPSWNRHQPRPQTAKRPALLPAKIARLSRPPLDDAKSTANDALIAELKQTFGSRAVQSTGQRNNEPSLQVDIASPLLTDEVIGKIAGLTNVFVCNLSGPKITDAGIAKLTELQGVDMLRIGGDQLTACLPSLVACTEMKLLGLSSPLITDDGLAALRALTKVGSLQLHLPAITDAGLVHLANMPNLQYLWFSTKQFTDEGVRNLAKSKSLKNFDLWSLDLTDESLAAIADMESLESFQFFSKRLTNAGVAHLKRAPNLRGVHLYSPLLTDDALSSFGEMPKLERLGLHDAPITDEGLAKLKDRTDLQDLYLVNCNATGAGLRYLAGSNQLKNLTLTGPAVNDVLFVHIEQFPKLRNLNAGRVERASIEGGISDEGLKRIVSCQDLFSIYLDYTCVTDAGLAPILEMPKLQSVQFRYSPGVTKTGIAKLKETLPSLSAGVY